MKEMHHLVKQSTKPLESLIGIEIPEHETILYYNAIGGWMRSRERALNEKLKLSLFARKVYLFRSLCTMKWSSNYFQNLFS